MLHALVKGWGVQRLWVGSSGEFTIERALLDLGLEYRCQDTGLWASCLGRYLTGAESAITLRPEAADDLDWMKPFMATPEGRLACLAISMEMAEPWLRREENGYFGGLAKAYQTQFPDLHAKIAGKLAATKVRLDQFHQEDPVDFQRRWAEDPEGGFIAFPPVKAGDKASVSKSFKAIWDWADEVVTPPFNEKRLQLMIDLAKTRAEWVIGTKAALPDMEEFLVGTAQNTARGTKFHVYTSGRPRRQVVVPHQKVADPGLKKVNPLEVKGGKLGIFLLKMDAFSSLRSQYLNERIRPGSVTAGFGVTVNGMLLGVFAIDTSTKAFSLAGVESPSVYLMSDFPVVKGKRLAKLVVMAALSRESQILMERITKKRIRSITTTAFTERPVSMKYRNVFKLLAKNPASEEDKREGYAWKLSYGGAVGLATLEATMKQWEALCEG